MGKGNSGKNDSPSRSLKSAATPELAKSAIISILRVYNILTKDSRIKKLDGCHIGWLLIDNAFECKCRVVVWIVSTKIGNMF